LSCIVCGGHATISHHVSYDPERRAPVCKSCHTRIHAHRSEHRLLPDYIPLNRTRTKKQAPLQMSGHVLARLERMVHELGLCDVNHAIETLCEEQSTEDEQEAADCYVWSRSDGIKSKAKHAKEMSDAMRDVFEKRGW